MPRLSVLKRPLNRFRFNTHPKILVVTRFLIAHVKIKLISILLEIKFKLCTIHYDILKINLFLELIAENKVVMNDFNAQFILIYSLL